MEIRSSLLKSSPFLRVSEREGKMGGILISSPLLN